MIGRLRVKREDSVYKFTERILYILYCGNEAAGWKSAQRKRGEKLPKMMVMSNFTDTLTRSTWGGWSGGFPTRPFVENSIWVLSDIMVRKNPRQ
jgi:hypothetical protein